MGRLGAKSRLGAATQERNPTIMLIHQPISVGLRSEKLMADRVLLSLHPTYYWEIASQARDDEWFVTATA